MLKKGKWTVPGYRVRSLIVGMLMTDVADILCRRNSESFLSCRENAREAFCHSNALHAKGF